MSKFTLLAATAACTLALAAGAARADTTLTIATVNNVQMIEMQKLAPQFEKAHPDIHLRWVTLEENTARTCFRRPGFPCPRRRPTSRSASTPTS